MKPPNTDRHPITTKGRRKFSRPCDRPKKILSLHWSDFECKSKTDQICDERDHNESHAANVTGSSNTNTTHLRRIQFSGKWINDQERCRNHGFRYQKYDQCLYDSLFGNEHGRHAENSTGNNNQKSYFVSSYSQSTNLHIISKHIGHRLPHLSMTNQQHK